MIRRRTFLIACSGVVAAPALAQLAVPPTTSGLPRSGGGGASVPTALPAAPGMQDVALRIDGWDAMPDSGPDVWVHINSSWRATWR
jgi:hypothetical protein